MLESVLKENRSGIMHQVWDLESQAKTMLTTSWGSRIMTQQIGHAVRRPEKACGAGSASFLSPADLLILDEPTNHLDSAMADWLEDVSEAV